MCNKTQQHRTMVSMREFFPAGHRCWRECGGCWQRSHLENAITAPCGLSADSLPLRLWERDSTAAISGTNTQGGTLITGCGLRDSPRGLWPVDSLQPFCRNPGDGDEPSIRPQLTLHEAEGEGKKKERGWLMCLLCGWSLSSHTHKHAHACEHRSKGSDVSAFSHGNEWTFCTYTNPRRCLNTSQGARTRTPTLSPQGYIPEDGWWKPSLSIFELRGEWRGID